MHSIPLLPLTYTRTHTYAQTHTQIHSCKRGVRSLRPFSFFSSTPIQAHTQTHGSFSFAVLLYSVTSPWPEEKNEPVHHTTRDMHVCTRCTYTHSLSVICAALSFSYLRMRSAALLLWLSGEPCLTRPDAHTHTHTNTHTHTHTHTHILTHTLPLSRLFFSLFLVHPLSLHTDYLCRRTWAAVVRSLLFVLSVSVCLSVDVPFFCLSPSPSFPFSAVSLRHTHTRTHVHTHTRTHTRTHTHTNKYTHTNTHTHTHSLFLSLSPTLFLLLSFFSLQPETAALTPPALPPSLPPFSIPCVY